MFLKKRNKKALFSLMRNELEGHTELLVHKDDAGVLYKDEFQKAETLAQWLRFCFRIKISRYDKRLEHLFRQSEATERSDIGGEYGSETGQ